MPVLPSKNYLDYLEKGEEKEILLHEFMLKDGQDRSTSDCQNLLLYYFLNQRLGFSVYFFSLLHLFSELF